MNGYNPDIVHRVHNELMEDINQRDIIIAELKSQTQELQEQNAELVITLETIVSLITNQTSMSTVKTSILQVLTKYNHLKVK